MSRRELAQLSGARRELLDQLLDKWSISVLAVLCDGPQRFSRLKSEIQGITQKSLSQALRRLERNGMIHRRVIDTSPVAVEYRITELGRTLEAPIAMLQAWSVDALPAVEDARDRYDAHHDDSTGPSEAPAASTLRTRS
ncbi:winged helix-turn-helix transcriptional regulator [Agromyces aurantiacus]|uniref:Winged helix-turn-helix transcriptional regulator n=1 Tax=Agromyces aurantiacus TaxID=165814 RepID=A0ABV9R2N3_9MICO|nr:helix-turn-helix domain-containing protein [Agromyces aurantiacus]MBM7502763.1 DNA-binding HxlR family transcriptional regulator [Agromyces aurantiacus]